MFPGSGSVKPFIVIPHSFFRSSVMPGRRVRDRWGKREVSVPKGLLMHITLKMLSRGVHSGTELMDKIESRTGWRPSSGSIYPLLSSLNDEGVIRQVECPDQSIKRFTITHLGEAEM